MAKRCSDTYMDAMLNLIATANRVSLCSAEPATIADITTLGLASEALTSGAGNGDLTLANGASSGRQLTVEARTDLSISANGTADHVAIDDGTNLYVTTCPPVALTTGGAGVDISAWTITVPDPV